MTRPIVVPDSGPLIALAVCDQLDLLAAVFDAIDVPQVVVDETTSDHSRPGAIGIASFVQRHCRVHGSRNDDIYAAAVTHLDEGEAQALSLAHALRSTVLLDERHGRQTAMRLGLPLIGAAGVLLQAKRIGRLERIGPVLLQMQNNGYRISQAIVEQSLRLADESA